MSSDKKLVPVFIPSLASLLIHAEDAKQSPLTLDEALGVRNKAAVIMLPADKAGKMDESRGYPDIDPENLWFDWQNLRDSLDRKPHIDPGPKFTHVTKDDAELVRAAALAQTSLPHFSKLLEKLPAPETYAMIKVRLTEAGKAAQMWLLHPVKHGDNFHAELFQVPAGWTTFKTGDVLTVPSKDINDWAINCDGLLHGGYTMRIFRNRKPASEQAAYDEFIGVKTYAPLP